MISSANTQPTIKQIFKLFFAKHYQEALQTERQILFLLNWHKFFQAKKAELDQHLPRSSIYYAYQILNLLSTIKSQYLTEFFTKKLPLNGDFLHEILAKKIFFFITKDLLEIDAATFLEKLHEEQSALEKQVISLENAAKNYRWWQGCLGRIGQITTSIYYYTFANSVSSLIEEITTEGVLNNVPILNTRLDQNYRFGMDVLGSLLLFGLDYKFTGLTGPGLALAHTITHRLENELPSALALGKKCGISQDQVLRYLPRILHNINMGFGLLFNIILAKFTGGSMGLATFSYLLALLCSKSTGALINSSKHLICKTKTNERIMDLTLKPVAQHVSYYLGARFLTPRLYETYLTFFTPPNTVLFDDKFCKAHTQICHNIALKVIAVEPDATEKEIQRSCRLWQLNNSPDILGSNVVTENAAALHNAACKILTDKQKI
ncbi:MAG: hypothetical protein A2X78_00285 [Gammaproteobacteria bacterium GWE2_37_16]|nr:MAG: hypothetical protein A2X78_00285 [Gammaproteobacteria bacterium GWE2_37_16]